MAESIASTAANSQSSGLDERVLFTGTWSMGGAIAGAAIFGLLAVWIVFGVPDRHFILATFFGLIACAIYWAATQKTAYITDKRGVFVNKAKNMTVAVPLEKIEYVTISGSNIKITSGSILNALLLNLNGASQFFNELEQARSRRLETMRHNRV
jgi:MFS family permease